MKVCSKCGLKKPLNEFKAERKRGRIYVRHCCRACVAAYQKKWFAENRDTVQRRRTPYMKNYHAKNRAAVNARNARYKREHPERYRDSYLKTRYGIGVLEYEALLSGQGGVCAVCRQPEENTTHRDRPANRLAVDHCHETGQVRGLLCADCNRAFGLTGDSVTLLRGLIAYLQSTRATACVERIQKREEW